MKILKQNIITNEEARGWIIRNLLEKDGLFKLSEENIASICELTEGSLINFVKASVYEMFITIWKFPSFYMFNITSLVLPGYSGSDMKNLVKDASMGPLREALGRGIDISKLQKEDMRPVTLQVLYNSSTYFTYKHWADLFI